MAVKTVAAGGGTFATGATWVGGVAPVTGDSIVANATSGNLTLGANTVNLIGADFTGYTGTLALQASLFNSSGTITLGSGMTITNTTTGGRLAAIAPGLTIISNGVRIPAVGTPGGTAITFTGTASIGFVGNNGTLTGSNIIYYGNSLPSATPTVIGSTTVYIKPDTTLQIVNTTTLMTFTPRVIFDTTALIDTQGPIVVSLTQSYIGFLQRPGFNLGSFTQSAIVYTMTSGINTHTLDIGTSSFKLDRLAILPSSAASTSTFNILGATALGLTTITPQASAAPGSGTSSTTIVSNRNITIDELVVTSEYSRAQSQAGMARTVAIPNTVRFASGVTYSISSLNVSGVNVPTGRSTISSMTASTPVNLLIGTYSFDNTDIIDINNIGSTDYAFVFSNNTITRTTGITSSFPSSGGGAGGSFTFVS
jgi:hypothetical protein